MIKITPFLRVATLLAATFSSSAFAEELAFEQSLGSEDTYTDTAKFGAGGGLCMDVFMAGDAWSMKADDSDNNNFGFRSGINSSFGGDGVRGQLGASVGLYDFFGREAGPRDSREEAETQAFITMGAFKRADVCSGERISWGVVWDYMSGHNWGENADSVDLHQVRFLAGYALNERREVGIWGAAGINDDIAVGLTGSPLVSPMNQLNLYMRRNWEFGGETMLYLGGADDQYNLGQFVLGFNGRVPLNHRASLFGGVHYIVPSTSPGDRPPNGVQNSYSEETWNVTCGLVWTFGPGSSGRQNSPLLPVANNGSFAVAAPVGRL